MKQIVRIMINGQQMELSLKEIKTVFEHDGKVYIKLTNGEQILLTKDDDYLLELYDGEQSVMVINNQSNVSQVEQLQEVIKDHTGSKFGLEEDELVYAIAGLAGAGAAVTALNHDDSESPSPSIRDTTAPESLTADLDGDTITGSTEAGAVVTASYNGRIIGKTTADNNGDYQLTLDKAYTNGESIEVTATDTAGNATPEEIVSAPDTTAPVILSQDINKAGDQITGTSEAGAVVRVLDDGTEIARGTADAEGNYQIDLPQAYANGETLTLLATDTAGNESQPATVEAGDTTAPESLTADLDGDTITGSTEAGAVVTASYNGRIIGKTTADNNGDYQLTLDKAYTNGESIEVTATDTAGNATPEEQVYASITQYTFNDGDVELQEVFEDVVREQSQALVNDESFGSLYEVYNFSVTGDNAIPLLRIVDNDGYASVRYNYQLTGDGYSSSSSNSITSSGSSYDETFKLSDEPLPTGDYTLEINVNAGNADIELNIAQTVEVVTQEFTGYEVVTGNIFADSEDTRPENYELRVQDQTLQVTADSDASDKVIVTTDNGELTVQANGDYRYQSSRTELGLSQEALSEDFDIVLYDLQGDLIDTYDLTITPDVTPPEAGELVLNNYEDTGISDTDDITTDDRFEASVVDNEAGSSVDIEYSTDNGQSWQILEEGNIASLLPSTDEPIAEEAKLDGDYLLRGKVSDEAGNVSYTEERRVSIDTIAPELNVGIDEQIMYDLNSDSIMVDSDADQLEVYRIDGEERTELADTSNVDFEPGLYELIATDVAGNSTTVDLNMALGSGFYEPDDESISQVVKSTLDMGQIYGGSDDDILISNKDYDSLNGEDGDDILIYGGDAQEGFIGLYGDNGNDDYVIDTDKLPNSNNFENDITIQDYYGNNELYLQNIVADDVLLSKDRTSVFISEEGKDWQIKLYDQRNGGDDGIETIYFDDGTTWSREYIDSVI